MIRICLLLLASMIIIINCKERRLVSSNSLWVFCYSMIFIFYPTFTEKFFSNMFQIDIWALVGLIMFLLGTILENKIQLSDIKSNEYYLEPVFSISNYFYWGIVVAFLILMYQIMGIQGFFSVIRGSLTANELMLSKNNSPLYVYLMNLMVPFVLAVWVSSKNSLQKKQRLLCLATFIAISIIFGYTRLFLICVLICCLFYELRNKSIKKQALILMLFVVAMTFLMVTLNFIRYFGRGKISDLLITLNPAYFFESTDFGASYRWFSELLKIDSPYIFPLTYLKPLFALIPRTIWARKSEPISLDILKILDPTLAATGYSTAGNSVLGEGYAILGYTGIIFFPFLWGIITTLLDRKYYMRLRNGIDGKMSDCFYYIFSSFIIISGQRGDWSQYNIIIVWLFLIPLYFISKFRIVIKKNTKK